jgi:hypothetical protein
MTKSSYLGLSQDGKYIFTNKGIYTAKGHGSFTRFDDACLPKLVEIAQDNNEYELKKGLITLHEYSLRPKKILSTLLESVPKSKSYKIIKEWDEKFGRKLLLSESFQPMTVKSVVNESFESIKSLFLEQTQNYNTAMDITNNIITALSKTFNDDEEGALKQVKRINSVDLLNNVEKIIKQKKGMNLINYLNDEMSDVDWEYKSIYQHLQNLKKDYSKGYKENKFYQGVGKVVDVAASGLAVIGKALSKAAQAIIVPIIKKGVIPFMRWIRRNLNTYVGIIVDVVLSFTPAVAAMKVIWSLIVVYDIYEIATGDYDPDDPDRKQMPYIMLLVDIVSLAFTAAAGKAAGVSLKSIAKGVKPTGVAKGFLQQAIESVPVLRRSLTHVKTFLTKLFGEGNIISKLFGYVDGVLTNFINWCKKMIGGTVAQSTTKKGVGKLGLGGALGLGIAELFAEKSFGEGKSGIYGRGKEVQMLQKGLLRNNEDPELSGNFKGKVNGVYDRATGDAIYRTYQKFGMTPKRDATPYIAMSLGVELQPDGVFKYIPPDVSKGLGETMASANKKMETLAKKMGVKTKA